MSIEKPSASLAVCAASCGAALLLAAFSPCAQAARPLSTDDAEVQAPGECELDAYAGNETARAMPATQAAAFQLGCGVGARTYLGLAYARAFDDGEAPQTVAVLGKTSLFESAGEGGAKAALSWGGVGKKVRGTAFRYDGAYATLVAQLALRGWTTALNLGASADRGDHSLTARWAVSATHALPGDAVAGIEALGDDRHGGALLQTGACVPLRPGLAANASWGLHTGGGHGRIATAGLTWDF